jgi:prefoldin subunit 5
MDDKEKIQALEKLIGRLQDELDAFSRYAFMLETKINILDDEIEKLLLDIDSLDAALYYCETGW